MNRRTLGLVSILLLTSCLLLFLAGCGSDTTASNVSPQPQPIPQPTPQPSPQPTPTPSPNPAGVHDLVYVTNQLSDTISGYSFDGANATATPGSPYITDFGPGSIVRNAAGTVIFAVMEQEAPTVKGSNCFNAPAKVISYVVDAASGSLTLAQRLDLQKFCEYGAVVSGNSLYLIGKDQGSDNWLEVVNFDASGNMTEAPGSPFNIDNAGLDFFKFALDPSGNFMFVTNRNASVNNGVPGLLVLQKQATGSWQTSSTANVTAQWDVALTPNSRTLMTVDMNGSTVTTYTVDPASGVVTPHGALANPDHPFRVVADPTGHFFAVAAANGIWIFTVDAAGNAATVAGSPFAGGPGWRSIAFDSTGQYLTAVSESATIFSVNPSTGVLTQVAGPLTLGEYPRDVLMLSK